MNLEEEIIKTIAEHLGVAPREITKESSFTKDFNASQLEITDLFLVLEEKFHIKILEDESKHLERVGDLINYIAEHIDEPSPL